MRSEANLEPRNLQERMHSVAEVRIGAALDRVSTWTKNAQCVEVPCRSARYFALSAIVCLMVRLAARSCSGSVSVPIAMQGAYCEPPAFSAVSFHFVIEVAKRHGTVEFGLYELARIFGKFLANGFLSENGLIGKSWNHRINTGDLWWAWVDLNHRPRPYQDCELRNTLAQQEPLQRKAAIRPHDR
jgi:hypothetical protein